jgi:hypothetical protein
LTDRPDHYTETTCWAESLGAQAIVTTKRWGVLTERRLRIATGLEVEVGVASPSWASTEPLDQGTARIVSDGLRMLYDPDQLLHELVEAVRRR